MAKVRGDNQAKILQFIRSEIQAKGYPPSVREICDGVGLRSTSTVHGHLMRLERKGLLRRDPTKPRAMELINDPLYSRREMSMVPLVGKVTAGTPILAIENVEETFPLPSDLLGDGEHFMLLVQGESMVNAGILDGDYVVVRKQPTANNGEIVVGMIDDEATVKRFFKEDSTIRLQPENDFMEPIYARNVTILGKVVTLIRRF